MKQRNVTQSKVIKQLDLGNFPSKEDMIKKYGDEYADSWELSIIKSRVSFDLVCKGYLVHQDKDTNILFAISSAIPIPDETPLVIQVIHPSELEVFQVKYPLWVAQIATVIDDEVNYYTVQ